MQIKIKNDEYIGEVDDLVDFFNKTNVDVPSLFNAPRAYKIPPVLIWICIVLYFVGLIVGYFCSNDLKFIMNLLCLASMAVCSILCYIKFKKRTIAGFILLAGLIIYLFSTKGITNDDIVNMTNRGINKVLTPDSLNNKKTPH